jgi:hypothetical protein
MVSTSTANAIPRVIVIAPGRRVRGKNGDAFYSAVDKLAGAVDGAKTRITSVGGSVYATITASPEAYKAAGDAFKLAGNWSPDRLFQSWKCGTWLGGGGGTPGDCDPVAILWGQPESAR